MIDAGVLDDIGLCCFGRLGPETVSGVLSGVNDGGILSLPISTGELDEDESVRFLRVKNSQYSSLFTNIVRLLNLENRSDNMTAANNTIAT